MQKRRQAGRTPGASRPRTPRANYLAKRLECVELARAVSWPHSAKDAKAPASRTHSRRFATQEAPRRITSRSVWSASSLLALFCFLARQREEQEQRRLTSAATRLRDF